VSSDHFCQELVRKFGKPIVSTSANISGEPAPSIFHEISEEILGQADYAVSWRQDESASAPPSSIIKLDDKGHISIIRK
jgi:L-threonylcarbamoyladenylate synthase